jgi:rfaE bifunctional protein kinase chain/domain
MLPLSRKVISEWVARFGSARVLVVGDVMLDEFLRGDVRRISPEAPVPILEVRTRDLRLGGSANAAANVRALGGSATVVGVVGNDSEGACVERLLAESGLFSTLVRDCERPTTRKTRLVARGQQMMRADSESCAPIANAALEALLDGIDQAMQQSDVCILSDYAKGVVSARVAAHVLSRAAERGVPVVVDPKQRDFTLYRGATVVTPNLKELELAVGHPLETEDRLLAAATALLPALAGGAILVTRGPDGMSLVRDGAAVVHVRASAKTVFDVTGAGDTVVAVLALSLAANAPLEFAIELASAAAGVVVSKEGTATLSPSELLAVLP